MPKRKKKLTKVSEQLKTAIRDADLTDYRLGQMSGIAPIMIGRFMSGERSLKLETVDRLCDALELELRPKR